jgi:hypothetical protein
LHHGGLVEHRLLEQVSKPLYSSVKEEDKTCLMGLLEKFKEK